jgi:hypothetical protein
MGPQPIPGGRPANLPSGGQGSGKGKFSLAQQWKQHPGRVVAVAGVAAVAVFALYKRGAGSSSATQTGSDTGSVSNATPVQGTYDSTDNGIYDSVESQLGTLQDQLSALTTTQQTPTGTTTGTSTTSSGTTVPSSVKSGFYRDVSTGNIYEVENGSRYSVTPSTLSKLMKSTKKPTINSVDNGWAGFQATLQKTRV